MKGKNTVRILSLRILLLVALTASGATRADLLSAQLAYSKGDYEQAFKDYRDLAELGQSTAQYNLAIMYAKGQGVRQSELEAYAWASLAADNGDPSGRQLADQLRSDLAPGSEKIADQTRTRFGRQALSERLMPNIDGDAMVDQLQSKRCYPVQTHFPLYPVDAGRKFVQGRVSVEFTVHADGSARNPRIVYQVPEGVFDGAVRESLLRSRFPTAAPDSKPVHCSIYYNFVIPGYSSGDYPALGPFVTKTRNAAQSGDPQAELMYGMLLAGVPQLGKKRSDALPWFLKSAQAGSPVAQYQIGYSLLKGWGCHCEENKGSEWLRRAAEQDQPDAEVALAEYALRGTPDEESVKRARIWLERAVARGNRDGKLYLAALLAAAPYAEMRDPARALALLEQVFAGVDDDPTAFEIRAAAAANSGNFANAVMFERKALDRATRLSWDVAPLRERYTRYQSQQAWYGDLLGF